MDFGSWTASNADLLQHISTLVWIQTGNADMAEKVSAARIGYIRDIALLLSGTTANELYQRLSGQRDVDQLRNQTIAAIAQYVKDHPKASKEDLQKVLAKYIFEFAHKVDQI